MKTRFFAACLGCLGVLLPALAGAEGAPASDPSPELDALYAKRDDPAVAKQLEGAVDAALKAHPNDYGVLWRASRQKYWLSDANGLDEKQKRQLGKEGWDLGDRATKANPNGAEGLYFAAIGMGSYSQAVGILKAIGEGLEGEYNDRLDKSIKLNDDFDVAGPLVAKGRYYYELPWPKRNLEKSRETLGKVVARHPESLRAHLYLAESLLKDGEAKKAKEEIDKVAAGSLDYDPPEARRIKERAKPVAEKIAKELK